MSGFINKTPWLKAEDDELLRLQVRKCRLPRYSKSHHPCDGRLCSG